MWSMLVNHCKECPLTLSFCGREIKLLEELPNVLGRNDSARFPRPPWRKCISAIIEGRPEENALVNCTIHSQTKAKIVIRGLTQTHIHFLVPFILPPSPSHNNQPATPHSHVRLLLTGTSSVLGIVYGRRIQVPSRSLPYLAI